MSEQGDTVARARELTNIEADRRLRAWAREEGQTLRDEQKVAPARHDSSESPIERRLLDAFLRAGFQTLAAVSDIVVGCGPLGLLLQQLPVTSAKARYRLDFALRRPKAGVFLAIEADGRDFHDRTPEQARRDRERDRRLTAAGWTVLRFSGSEVHRDPDACVREVLEIAASERVPRAMRGRE